jgi:hypothetical protein
MKICKCGSMVHEDGCNIFGMPHVCPPQWECYELLNGTDEDAQTIYAIDEAQAAEKYFEYNDADMECLNQIDVMVRKLGERSWLKVSVVAESMRQFRAL